MNQKLALKIRRRTQPGWLCWLIIVMPFLFGTLNGLLGLPWSIRYLIDVAWFALLLMMTVYRQRLQWRNTRKIIIWVVLFLIYTAMIYLPQYQNGLYYLWGVRNNFRFYAAFLAFSVFLSSRDIDDYYRLFDRIFWLDVVVSLVQFFILDMDGDQLGGVFGAETGANGYTNVFFCIILTKSVIFYLSKKEKLSTCAWKFVSAMIVAAMAEIKFFFAETVLIIILAVLFTDFSWRKVMIIVGGFAGITVGAILLTALFPNSTGFLSLRYFWEMATISHGYTSSGDMNRLNAISVINDQFLKNGWARLFGLGMGNCATSTFSFLNTPFFEKYGDLHYTWLSYAMMYLECGWIGLVFYFGFFVLVYYKVKKFERASTPTEKAYCRITRIMAVLCAVISIYNSSLCTETGYMAYFVLAVPFAVIDRSNERKYEK